MAGSRERSFSASLATVRPGTAVRRCLAAREGGPWIACIDSVLTLIGSHSNSRGNGRGVAPDGHSAVAANTAVSTERDPVLGSPPDLMMPTAVVAQLVYGTSSLGTTHTLQFGRCRTLCSFTHTSAKLPLKEMDHGQLQGGALRGLRHRCGQWA